MASRVLFIQGPTQDAKRGYHGWPTSLLHAVAPSVDAMASEPLGLTHERRFFEPEVWSSPHDEVVTKRQLEAALESADVVCASTTYDSVWPVLQMLQHAKQVRGDVITVLGGPHVDETHAIERFCDARLHPGTIDYAIAGDGELALLALLRGLANGQRVPEWDMDTPEGFFRTYSKGVQIDQGDRPLQLDLLPALPIELADTPARRNNLARLLGRADLAPAVETVAQRGCVYKCDCCSERDINTNARSIESIVSEVTLRKAQGFRTVFFNDSTFGLFSGGKKELLRALGHTGMTFGCLNRFDHLNNAAMLDAYKAAGFVYFYCAVEQFDDSVLRLMTKAENTARMEMAARMLHERGFVLGVSLLYGLPGESRTSIQRTLDFVGQWVERGLIRLVSQSALSLHPGTPAGKDLVGTFERPPPNRGFPFDEFEEGQWYHPPHVTAKHLEWIAIESRRRFGNVLVRGRGEA